MIVDLIDEIVDFLVHIVLVKTRIVHDGIVTAESVKTETTWRVVSVWQDSGEELTLQAEIGASLPKHFSRLGLASVVKVLVVSAAQEEAIEAKLSKERGLLSGMSKGVNLPSRSRTSAASELLQNELEAQSLLVDDVLVVSGSLVVHAPCADDEFQSTLADQCLDQALGRIVLLVPPAPEVRNLYVNKSLGWIFGQFLDNSV